MADDISKMCLLCRSNTDVDGISLLDPSKKITMEEISVLFNLKICSKNGLPTKICLQCFNRVIDFMALQYMCSMSYEYFCEYLNRFQSNDEQFESMTINTAQTSINEQENSDHQISQPESTTTSESYQILEGTSIKICKLSSHSDVSGTLINDKSGTLNDKYGTLNCKSGTLISDKSAVAEPNKTSNSSPVALKPSGTHTNNQIATVSPPKLKELLIVVNRNEVKKYLEKQHETLNIKIKIENDIDENDYKEKFAAAQQMSVHNAQENHEELESVKSEVNSPLNDNAETDSEVDLELKPKIRMEEMDWTFLDDNEATSISAVDFAFIKNEISKIQPIPAERFEHNTGNPHTTENLRKQHLASSHHFTNEEISKSVSDIFKYKQQFSNVSKHKISHVIYTNHNQCDICGQKFFYKSHLAIHMTSHLEPQYTCPHCDKKFKHESSLKLHIKTLHSSNSSKYECDLCKKTFNHKIHLQIHFDTVHNIVYQSSRKCDTCDKCFKVKDYLLQHKLSTHREFKYRCDHCVKSFRRLYSSKSHIKYQHSRSKHKCYQCKENFNDSYSLENHIKNIHVPLSVWKCDKCEKCFKDKLYLQQHKQKFHNKSWRRAKIYSLLDAKFCCVDCGKKFKQGCHLKRHIESLHSGGIKKYICDHCEQKFKRKAYLRNHITYVHIFASETSWKCDECGKCFKSKHCLSNHEANVHRGFRFPCVHCGKKFKIFATLKRHNDSQHGGGICNYKCDQCELKFKSLARLAKHINLVHFDGNS